MIALVLAVAFILLILVYVKTGRSPFYWGAMAFIFLEALRAETYASAVPAAQEFARRVRVRVAVVRLEISA